MFKRYILGCIELQTIGVIDTSQLIYCHYAERIPSVPFLWSTPPLKKKKILSVLGCIYSTDLKFFFLMI